MASLSPEFNQHYCGCDEITGADMYVRYELELNGRVQHGLTGYISGVDDLSALRREFWRGVSLPCRGETVTLRKVIAPLAH
jgi:hypothetical protein